MSNYCLNEDLAKIAISKNVIKEYKDSNSQRTVYLNDGSEFQIYIKNPNQYHVGMKIYVNDKMIGPNYLVLKPGQSIWLDRYLDCPDKFMFSTYTVEDSTEMRYAIAKNGVVKIEFHKEYERPVLYSNVFSCAINSVDTINTVDSFTSYDSGTFAIKSPGLKLCNNSSGKLFGSSASVNSVESKGISTMETGRIERGGHSNQDFNTIDMTFESYPFKTEIINILPTSRKNTTVEETRRKYCSNCGKKVKQTDKYCSNCGTKLN